MIRQPGREGGSAPIRSKRDLVEHFARAARPRGEHRVGTEYEKHCLLAPSGRPVPYHGPAGIERLLAHLVERNGRTPRLEAGTAVAVATTAHASAAARRWRPLSDQVG